MDRAGRISLLLIVSVYASGMVPCSFAQKLCGRSANLNTFKYFCNQNIFAGLVTVVSGNKCSADAMSRCTDPLKVVTDNKDLGFATSKDELDEMCP